MAKSATGLAGATMGKPKKGGKGGKADKAGKGRQEMGFGSAMIGLLDGVSAAKQGKKPSKAVRDMKFGEAARQDMGMGSRTKAAQDRRVFATQAKPPKTPKAAEPAAPTRPATPGPATPPPAGATTASTSTPRMTRPSGATRTGQAPRATGAMFGRGTPPKNVNSKMAKAMVKQGNNPKPTNKSRPKPTISGSNATGSKPAGASLLGGFAGGLAGKNSMGQPKKGFKLR